MRWDLRSPLRTLAGLPYDARVDEMVCLTVNDRSVMQAWTREEGVRAVALVSDGSCASGEALHSALYRPGGGRRRGWRLGIGDRASRTATTAPVRCQPATL